MASLQTQWKTLYTQTLPQLARSKDPAQPHWPVQLDHCFARIILDAIIGQCKSSFSAPSPAPWTANLKAPAINNMSGTQLKECIELGKAIAAGEEDLVELDRQSLKARGKALKDNGTMARKRKREEAASTTDATPMLSHHTAGEKPQELPATVSPSKTRTKSTQSSILRYTVDPPPPTPAASTPSPEIVHKINSHQTITPFQKRVYLTLCQVPYGQHTTYAAISKHLHSSPRAVGNALRSNIFAPQVPCHRVIASNGGIGGFNGDWGKEGRYAKTKVSLLRREGVKVAADGGGVSGRVWEGFVRDSEGQEEKIGKTIDSVEYKE